MPRFRVLVKGGYDGRSKTIAEVGFVNADNEYEAYEKAFDALRGVGYAGDPNQISVVEVKES